MQGLWPRLGTAAVNGPVLFAGVPARSWRSAPQDATREAVRALLDHPSADGLTAAVRGDAHAHGYGEHHLGTTALLLAEHAEVAAQVGDGGSLASLSRELRQCLRAMETPRARRASW